MVATFAEKKKILIYDKKSRIKQRTSVISNLTRPIASPSAIAR